MKTAISSSDCPGSDKADANHDEVALLNDYQALPSDEPRSSETPNYRIQPDETIEYSDSKRDNSRDVKLQAGEGNTQAISEGAFLEWVASEEWRGMRREALREKLMGFNYAPGCQTDETINTGSHLIGAFATILGGVLLIVESAYNGSSTAKVFGMVVYTVCMFTMFGCSTLHHGAGIGWGGNWVLYRFFRMMDHCAIFFMISGVYTPLVLSLCSNPFGQYILIYVWMITVIGVILQIIGQFTIPSWAFNILYLNQGWVAVLLIPQIYKEAGWIPIFLLFLGGILYSIGIVFYIFERIYIKDKFGSHEVFHLLILAAAAIHFAMIWLYALPQN